MAEDRGLEAYEQLLKLCERTDIYPRFIRDVCRKADQKYNSGLFHFQKESGVSEDPDRITPKLAIDDKVFKPILESLYFAHGSPYHFGVLPVEILGTVYERFLGKVIRLTAGHQAKIEEKPEVRKAGGVYYTPAYIVEYIVKHTIAVQIEGRSPHATGRGKKHSAFSRFGHGLRKRFLPVRCISVPPRLLLELVHRTQARGLQEGLLQRLPQRSMEVDDRGKETNPHDAYLRGGHRPTSGRSF
jgi:hypothetical protein